MKHIVIPVIILSVYLFSCSKKEDVTVDPAPVIYSDTLSAGWSKSVIAPNESFTDIAAQNNTTIYAVGTSMYRSTDGGSTWNKLAGYPVSNATNLTVNNDGKVFVTHGTNMISRSIDGGATFTDVTIGAASGNVFDVNFIDNSVGYSLTSGGLTTTGNAGASWSPVTPATGLVVNPSAYNTGWFFSSSSGVVATGAEIYKSNGTLNSWTKSVFTGGTPSYNLISLYATSSSSIFAAVSDGKIFQSTDGGATFNLKAALTTLSGKFMDIHFTDANTGYISYGNRLYKTTDAGTNWQVIVGLETSTIAEIYFSDATHGWACTDKGEILKLN